MLPAVSGLYFYYIIFFDNVGFNSYNVLTICNFYYFWQYLFVVVKFSYYLACREDFINFFQTMSYDYVYNLAVIFGNYDLNYWMYCYGFSRIFELDFIGSSLSLYLYELIRYYWVLDFYYLWFPFISVYFFDNFYFFNIMFLLLSIFIVLGYHFKKVQVLNIYENKEIDLITLYDSFFFFLDDYKKNSFFLLESVLQKKKDLNLLEWMYYTNISDNFYSVGAFSRYIEPKLKLFLYQLVNEKESIIHSIASMPLSASVEVQKKVFDKAIKDLYFYSHLFVLDDVIVEVAKDTTHLLELFKPLWEEVSGNLMPIVDEFLEKKEGLVVGTDDYLFLAKDIFIRAYKVIYDYRILNLTKFARFFHGSTIHFLQPKYNYNSYSLQYFFSKYLLTKQVALPYLEWSYYYPKGLSFEFFFVNSNKQFKPLLGYENYKYLHFYDFEKWRYQNFSFDFSYLGDSREAEINFRNRFHLNKWFTPLLSERFLQRGLFFFLSFSLLTRFYSWWAVVFTFSKYNLYILIFKNLFIQWFLKIYSYIFLIYNKLVYLFRDLSFLFFKVYINLCKCFWFLFFIFLCYGLVYFSFYIYLYIYSFIFNLDIVGIEFDNTLNILNIKHYLFIFDSLNNYHFDFYNYYFDFIYSDLFKNSFSRYTTTIGGKSPLARVVQFTEGYSNYMYFQNSHNLGMLMKFNTFKNEWFEFINARVSLLTNERAFEGVYPQVFEWYISDKVVPVDLISTTQWYILWAYGDMAGISDRVLFDRQEFVWGKWIAPIWLNVNSSYIMDNVLLYDSESFRYRDKPEDIKQKLAGVYDSGFYTQYDLKNKTSIYILAEMNGGISKNMPFDKYDEVLRVIKFWNDIDYNGLFRWFFLAEGYTKLQDRSLPYTYVHNPMEGARPWFDIWDIFRLKPRLFLEFYKLNTFTGNFDIRQRFIKTIWYLDSDFSLLSLKDSYLNKLIDLDVNKLWFKRRNYLSYSDMLVYNMEVFEKVNGYFFDEYLFLLRDPLNIFSILLSNKLDMSLTVSNYVSNLQANLLNDSFYFLRFNNFLYMSYMELFITWYLKHVELVIHTTPLYRYDDWIHLKFLKDLRTFEVLPVTFTDFKIFVVNFLSYIYFFFFSYSYFIFELPITNYIYQYTGDLEFSYINYTYNFNNYNNNYFIYHFFLLVDFIIFYIILRISLFFLYYKIFFKYRLDYFNVDSLKFNIVKLLHYSDMFSGNQNMYKKRKLFSSEIRMSYFFNKYYVNPEFKKENLMVNPLVDNNPFMNKYILWRLGLQKIGFLSTIIQDYTEDLARVDTKEIYDAIEVPLLFYNEYSDGFYNNLYLKNYKSAYYIDYLGERDAYLNNKLGYNLSLIGVKDFEDFLFFIFVYIGVYSYETCFYYLPIIGLEEIRSTYMSRNFLFYLKHVTEHEFNLRELHNLFGYFQHFYSNIMHYIYIYEVNGFYLPYIIKLIYGKLSFSYYSYVPQAGNELIDRWYHKIRYVLNSQPTKLFKWGYNFSFFNGEFGFLQSDLSYDLFGQLYKDFHFKYFEKEVDLNTYIWFSGKIRDYFFFVFFNNLKYLFILIFNFKSYCIFFGVLWGGELLMKVRSRREIKKIN